MDLHSLQHAAELYMYALIFVPEKTKLCIYIKEGQTQWNKTMLRHNSDCCFSTDPF